MNKTLKILAITLGSIVALLIVGAVIVSLVLDPNKYKDTIIQIAKQYTGRDLKIDGKMSLSFFPWLGVELPPLTLSNAPGFDKKPFAEVKQAGIHVKLLPLLRKEIVVKQITLDGLRLRLAKNSAGVTNWDDLGGAKGAQKPVDQPASDTDPSLGGLAIGSVAIRDAEVTWDDQMTGAMYSVKNMNLKTGQLAAGKPADLNLGFDFTSAAPKINTRVDVNARLTVDMDKQTLDMPKLSLEVAGMNLTLTDVKGSNIIKAPAFHGQLGIANFSPRTLMQKFGVKYETTDTKALAQASVHSAFSASSKDVQLKNIKITLDSTTINGSFALNDFAKLAYRFDINIDDIDIDRYMSPAATAKTQDVKTSKVNAPAAAPAAIPLDSLRKLNADGAIKIKKLKATGIRSTDVSTQIKAKDGIINIGPSSARLYSGNYKGNVGIDARGKEPTFSINEKVTGVQVGPMLKDMQTFDNFSGTGDISLQLSGRGLNAKQITQTLAGSMAFSLKDGAIQGADLVKKMEEGRAMYDQLKGKPVRVKAQKGEKTAFNVFSGSAVITNGIAQNNDLILETPSMRATGKGSADLPNETLDYRMNIIQIKSAEKKCANIPLLITGPFKDLNYAPDFAEILKCQGQKQIEKAKDEILQKGLESLFKKRKK